MAANYENSETAISDGAVIRYLNRHTGPSEILRASYGFLTQEPYSPQEHEGHRDANFEPVIDEEDGKPYWADCIAYFAQKVRMHEMLLTNVEFVIQYLCSS